MSYSYGARTYLNGVIGSIYCPGVNYGVSSARMQGGDGFLAASDSNSIAGQQATQMSSASANAKSATLWAQVQAGDGTCVATPGGPLTTLSEPMRAYGSANSEFHDTYTVSSATKNPGDPVSVTVGWRIDGSFSALVPASGTLNYERGQVFLTVSVRGAVALRDFGSSTVTQVNDSGTITVPTTVGATLQLTATLIVIVGTQDQSYLVYYSPFVANFSASAVAGSTDPDVIVTGAAYPGSLAPLTPMAWGNNSAGQLGDSTTTHRLEPVQVSGLTGVAAIAAGITQDLGHPAHSLALKSDGTVWSWGSNSSGQLGNGSTTDSPTPVEVVGPGGAGNLTDVIAVAAQGQHSVALKRDCTGVTEVWAWGDNAVGQLGDGSANASSTPVQVVDSGGTGGLTDVIAVAVGAQHSVALKADRTVWAWGANIFGQLGDGTNLERRIPVQVSGLSDVIAIGAGGYHCLALKQDGSVWAWGHNDWGELGDGTTINRPAPVQVIGLGNVGLPADVIGIAAGGGGGHSLALKRDGTIRAWGLNAQGGLGDGTTTNQSVPVPVTGLTDAIAIAGGGFHSLALKGDRTVWGWGANNFGQLGDGTVTDSLVPVQVHGLARAVLIAAGHEHSLCAVE